MARFSFTLLLFDCFLPRSVKVELSDSARVLIMVFSTGVGEASKRLSARVRKMCLNMELRRCEVVARFGAEPRDPVVDQATFWAAAPR